MRPPDIQGICGAPSTTTRKKRDPRAPKPSLPPRAAASWCRIPARRLHYDVRLEMDGGAEELGGAQGPLAATRRRSGSPVHVEDHPIEYGDFEGVIPSGNYGAGRSSCGTTAGTARASRRSPSNSSRAVSSRWRSSATRCGALDARAHVGQGQGVAPAQEGRRRRVPPDGSSRATLPAVGALRAHRRGDGDAPDGWPAVRARSTREAPRGEVDASAPRPSRWPPSRRGPSRIGWLFEIKYDGVRVLARAGRSRAILCGERPGHDLPLPGGGPRAAGAAVDALRHRRGDRGARRAGPTQLSAPAAAHGAHRPARDRDGRAGSGPRSASSSTASRSTTATCVARCPRRAQGAVGPGICPRWGRSATAITWSGGPRLLRGRRRAAARGHRAKRRGGHRGWAHARWIKIKCHQRQEFVMGGSTDPQGARALRGAAPGLYDGPAAALASSTSRRSVPVRRGRRSVIRDWLRPPPRHALLRRRGGAHRARAPRSSRDWCRGAASPTGPRKRAPPPASSACGGRKLAGSCRREVAGAIAPAQTAGPSCPAGDAAPFHASGPGGARTKAGSRGQGHRNRRRGLLLAGGGIHQVGSDRATTSASRRHAALPADAGPVC